MIKIRKPALYTLEQPITLKNNTLKFLLIFFLLFSYISHSQTNRFSIEANYGLAFSNFVEGYNEQGEGGFMPPGYVLIADKNFLGTVNQVQVNYHLKNGTSFILGYARDSHQKERNYTNPEGTNASVLENWSLRHNNNIFFGKHKRNISKYFKYHVGVFVIHPEQQEITVWEGSEQVAVYMDERDKPNNGLSDGGFLAGLDFEKQLGSKFLGGLHLTGYHRTSAATYETTYFTGSIAYIFNKKTN